MDLKFVPAPEPSGHEEEEYEASDCEGCEYFVHETHFDGETTEHDVYCDAGFDWDVMEQVLQGGAKCVLREKMRKLEKADALLRDIRAWDGLVRPDLLTEHAWLIAQLHAYFSECEHEWHPIHPNIGTGQVCMKCGALANH